LDLKDVAQPVREDPEARLGVFITPDQKRLEIVEGLTCLSINTYGKRYGVAGKPGFSSLCPLFFKVYRNPSENR